MLVIVPTVPEEATMTTMKPKPKQVSLRVPEPVWRAARVRALQEGQTLQAIMTQCLVTYAAGTPSAKKGARSR
jgi:predicted HicB family RNase H-like nuclease